MYQTVGHQAIELYAEAMDLPLYRRTIQGSSLDTSRNYSKTEGDEVEDLYELLHLVKVGLSCTHLLWEVKGFIVLALQGGGFVVFDLFMESYYFTVCFLLFLRLHINDAVHIFQPRSTGLTPLIFPTHNTQAHIDI